MKIHYHSDHLGSASFVTDAEGAVMQHLQYIQLQRAIYLPAKLLVFFKHIFRCVPPALGNDL